MGMKTTYTLTFIVSIVILTVLTVLALRQLTSDALEYQAALSNFNNLTGAITYIIFVSTTVLLVMAHFIIYKKKPKGNSPYIFIGLPYLFFIVFTMINYMYVYELYNIFQEKNGQVIDTPDMELFALNLSFLAFILAGINLALVKVLKKKSN